MDAAESLPIVEEEKTESNLGINILLRKKSFWLLAILMGTFQLGSVISQYSASYVLFLDGTLKLAGICTTAALLGNSSGKLILGILNDKIGIYKGNIVIFFLGFISFPLFLIGNIQAISLCSACFMVGFYNSMISVTEPTLTQIFFEKGDYSRVYSYLVAFGNLINAASVSVLGKIVDACRSYRPVYMVGLAGGILGFCVYHQLFKEVSYGTVTGENRKWNCGRIAGGQSDRESV